MNSVLLKSGLLNNLVWCFVPQCSFGPKLFSLHLSLFCFSRQDLSRTILCHFQAWPETLQRKIYIYIYISMCFFERNVNIANIHFNFSFCLSLKYKFWKAWIFFSIISCKCTYVCARRVQGGVGQFVIH